MGRHLILTAIAVVVLAAPAFSQVQSNSSGAKLGSKENPIPVTAVGTPVPIKKAKGKSGKRGSRTNPITGETHARTSN